MLKGYLTCKEINSLILKYIHYDLDKKSMQKTAAHLRNCPICMEKYSKLQKRKRELRKKLFEIQNQIKMENDISAYIDGEIEMDNLLLIKELVQWNREYKKEFLSQTDLRELLIRAKIQKTNEANPTIAPKIIREKLKKRLIIKKITQPFFQLLHHVHLKFQ